MSCRIRELTRPARRRHRTRRITRIARHLMAAFAMLGVFAAAPTARPAEPPPDQPTVVKLSATAPAKKARALKYPLLPDPLDLTPGNAATFWRRAGRAAVGVKRKLTEK